MGEKEIGAFEAKTRLPELLRGTARGESYLITRRGKPVARLVPIEERYERSLASLLEDLNSIRDGIEAPVDVRELIEEGRRF